MSEIKPVVLTSEGLEKAEKELEFLKTVKRQEIAEKIKIARGFGDLSENSEYDEAKDEQANMELRIVQLEKMLKNVKVIDNEEVSTDVVSLGSKIKVFDYDLDEEEYYYIVGSAEADPMDNKLSDESPIGAALLGKGIDEEVEVTVPEGVLKFKILEIGK